MSWQADKAVPLLAGEPFCEKPPLTYWLAAVPIGLLGEQAWVARLPNLLYALITALGVGLLASRSAGRFAGLVGAATISTFLLSYQVAIWLATDAPLLASVSVALLGAYIGFYATASKERLRGYLLMHAALALRISVQERGRLDGAGPGHSDLEHLGEALARTASMGIVCGVADSSGDHSHLGLVRVPRRRRTATLEDILLEQLGRPLRSGRRAARFAVRGGASQLAGQIPDRTAHVLIPVDIVGSGGGAARLAAAADLAARQSRRALRHCRFPAASRSCCPWPQRRGIFTSRPRCPELRC